MNIAGILKKFTRYLKVQPYSLDWLLKKVAILSQTHITAQLVPQVAIGGWFPLVRWLLSNNKSKFLRSKV
jgi:hypothetical protein